MAGNGKKWKKIGGQFISVFGNIFSAQVSVSCFIFIETGSPAKWSSDWILSLSLSFFARLSTICMKREEKIYDFA